MSITLLSPKQLQKKRQENPDLRLIDVREIHEFDFVSIAGSEHIPLARLSNYFNRFNPDEELVMICHHGIRSHKACEIFEQAGFNRLYNLQGGIDAWAQECEPGLARY